MTWAVSVTREGRKYALPFIPRSDPILQRLIQPCAGRIPTKRGSTGSPPENVRIKIPVIAQVIAEITYAAVMNSVGLVSRAITISAAAAAMRRMAAMEYLFRSFRLIICLGLVNTGPAFHSR